MLQLRHMASLISIGQVLDHSLEHGRKHYKELLAIVLWMVVASIPTIAGKLVALSENNSALTSGDWLSFSLTLLGVVLVTVVRFWMYATLTLTIADQAAGRRVNLKDTSRQGWKVFWRYVILTLALGLIMLGVTLLAAPGLLMLLIGSSDSASSLWSGLGMPLLFIGGLAAMFLIIKLTVELAFAPFLLLLEKRSVKDSITGSLALVRGRWWPTLLRFAIPKIVYFIGFAIVSFIVFKAIALLMAILAANSQIGVLLVYTGALFLSVFLSVIVTPFIVATDYYLYDSLRKTR